MHPNTALQLLSGQLPIDDLALLLPSRRVTGAQITRALATDTSVLRFITLSTADGPVRLFVKVASGAAHAAYREKNRRECAFYRYLLAHPRHGLPLPKCYAAFEDTAADAVVIILEDLSSTHRAPTAEDLRRPETWLRCAESLAALHSAFAEYAPEDEEPQTEADIQTEIRKNETYLTDFLALCDPDPDTETVLRQAMACHNRTLLHPPRSWTLCHGDAHIHNFLLPVDEGTPLLVDFQFWGDGPGTADVAHLTRVDFPEALRGEFEMALLRHYHACLTQHGLCLPWEECLSGYRASIAEMTLIPLWQCCAFSLPRAYWAGSLPGLVRNFRRMGCGDGL